MFVARQPVLDRSGSVVAHEILLGDDDAQVADDHGRLREQAGRAERVRSSGELERLIGLGDTFVSYADVTHPQDLIGELPFSGVVLEVAAGFLPAPQLVSQCERLRAMGYRLALDGVRGFDPALEALLPYVDVVKLDWPRIPADEAAGIVARFRQAGKQVLAERIDQRDAHANAMLAGCDLFQGFFFATPLASPVSRPSYAFAAILKVLRMLTADASEAEIEQALKEAPMLVVQLLRLANSSSLLSLRNRKIASIRQAFSVVGSRQLTRWCCLLLYGSPSGLAAENDPLVQFVTQRAAIMEFIAQETGGDSGLCQSAYLAGLLSLAHVSHGGDASTFIAELPVGPAIRAAVTERGGPLGSMLLIAEQLEAGGYRAALASCRAAFGPELAAHLANWMP
ncbi:EAL and HDOD domain-containing protein [Paraburkholderia lycopersici]|uniref:EAL and modified HD-GYP domain-containing signal transduction protein n=1 Tax=Paraburkholderia lycopersici TaxID=416944 RepID=A0A1G6HES3_9BURK|nr:EAL domain-containing protein [Paraburkholderia lycopersici]SDB92664.1 EAL and modified HD-GYP domain-containing signal transduction protein [Paraburkholderia lycopersici]